MANQLGITNYKITFWNLNNYIKPIDFFAPLEFIPAHLNLFRRFPKYTENKIIRVEIKENNETNIGFTQSYLQHHLTQEAVESAPDVLLFKQYNQMDSKLGMENSDQLYGCLKRTTRPDLLEVCLTRNFRLKTFIPVKVLYPCKVLSLIFLLRH